MALIIVFKRSDGGVSLSTTFELPFEQVVAIAEGKMQQFKEYPSEVWIKIDGEWILREVKEKLITGYRVTSVDNIPNTREFRDAWTDDVPSATVDVVLSKACNIHMQKIRRSRNEELDKLDKELSKATDQNNQVEIEHIKKRKQFLRDVPQKFDLNKAQTPEELKKLWPEGLKRN